ncbi:hypothetical protein V6N13_103516 [Hibiscus sabdariffa]
MKNEEGKFLKRKSGYCLKVKVEEFEDDRRFIDEESPFDLRSHEVTTNDGSVHVPCNNEVEVEGSYSEERPFCGSVEKVGGSNSLLGQRQSVQLSPAGLVIPSGLQLL